MSGDRAATMTAVAALVISLMSGAVTVFGALQGPEIEALPFKNVFVFATPSPEPGAAPASGPIAAAALAEIANTSSDYGDILLSQAVLLLHGDDMLACMSARGDLQFHTLATPDAELPELVQANAAEIIRLPGMALEVRDASSRAPLAPGALFSRRMLFDQVATTSAVDPCYRYRDAITENFTAQTLIERFAGERLELRYEARFAYDEGYVVSCRFDLIERRVERLSTRGYINAPCTESSVENIASEQTWMQNVQEIFDRLF